VKSGQLSKILSQLDSTLGGPSESQDGNTVDSMGKSLDIAMRTIGLAQPAPSGNATKLLPMPDPVPDTMPECPVQLPKILAGKDYTVYEGWYHTDITIPSVFFRADVERPHDQEPSRLDLTYLFHDDIDNPDHLTVGKGRRVRAEVDRKDESRTGRMVAESVEVSKHPFLQDVLARVHRKID
jgi:hypothetical protein